MLARRQRFWIMSINGRDCSWAKVAPWANQPRTDFHTALFRNI